MTQRNGKGVFLSDGNAHFSYLLLKLHTCITSTHRDSKFESYNLPWKTCFIKVLIFMSKMLQKIRTHLRASLIPKNFHGYSPVPPLKGRVKEGKGKGCVMAVGSMNALANITALCSLDCDRFKYVFWRRRHKNLQPRQPKPTRGVHPSYGHFVKTSLATHMVHICRAYHGPASTVSSAKDRHLSCI